MNTTDQIKQLQEAQRRRRLALKMSTDGKTQAEIAAKLGVSRARVQQYLSEAKESQNGTAGKN